MLHRLRHDGPGQHRPKIGAIACRDCRNLEVQHFRPQIDAGVVRQVGGVGEDTALMLGVPVKNVNGRAQQLLGLDRQQVLDRADECLRGLIDVVDGERHGIDRHHRNWHLVNHPQQAALLLIPAGHRRLRHIPRGKRLVGR